MSALSLYEIIIKNDAWNIRRLVDEWDFFYTTAKNSIATMGIACRVWPVRFISTVLIIGMAQICRLKPKLYIPSTLNIALLQWHTHLNVCAVK